MERVAEGQVMDRTLPGVTRGTPDVGSGPGISEGPEVVTEGLGDFGVKNPNILDQNKVSEDN